MDSDAEKYLDSSNVWMTLRYIFFRPTSTFIYQFYSITFNQNGVFGDFYLIYEVCSYQVLEYRCELERKWLYIH